MTTEVRPLSPVKTDEGTRAAFAWVEQTLDGRIVAAQLQPRWARQQWFLDVDQGGASPLRVVLRGRKSDAFGPGGASKSAGATGSPSGSLNASARRLEREAAVLSTLQNRPGIVVPGYFGYNDELGWLLQETMADEGLLTDGADEQREG